MGLKAGDSFVYSVDSDILEVKLMTSDYQTYFKMSAPIRDKNKMKKMLKELEAKGIKFNQKFDEPFGSDWFG